MKPWLVIGIGNAFRADDAAGLEVVRELAARRPEGITVTQSQGEPAALLEQLRGEDRVIVVDAIEAGREPGTVLRFDLSRGPMPLVSCGSASTHTLGLGEAIELARSLGRLPSTTLLFGIQAETFETGSPLSTAVGAAVVETADRILAEVSTDAFPTRRPSRHLS
jgi:hydrogenase maturation protease